MKRRPRIFDDKHLAFIRTLPCLITGENTSVEAAHIRYADPRIGKFNPGVGMKPDDFFTVPLSGEMHRRQHAVGNERKFWAQHNIDPVIYALMLYAVSGDYERGCLIVNSAMPANVLCAG